MSTPGLELHIAILQAELECLRRGKFSESELTAQGMADRLSLMQDEMARRDLYRLAKARRTPVLSDFSLGARASIRFG